MDLIENPVFSRYGAVRDIEVLSPNVYVMRGPSLYMRFGTDMVDFEGGPFLMVGDLYEGREILEVTSLASGRKGYGACQFTLAKTRAPAPKKVKKKTKK